MISINGVEIKPTVFPDKSQQVWKLPEDLLEDLYRENLAEVLWEFEGDHEFMTLAQLKTLLDTYVDDVHLNIPYLPYGRQDKRVSNEATFGLRTFANLLNSLNFSMVKTIDAHCNNRARMINNLIDENVYSHISFALSKTKADYIIFPDKGAKIRYGAHFTNKKPCLYASKERDQKTGWIKNVQIVGAPKKFKGKAVLVCDDLIDGGITFILVAKALQELGVESIYLYTTHGIYSKGFEPLRRSGISRFFTYKGEIKDPEFENYEELKAI